LGGTTGRISRIIAPKNDRLAVGLLNVRSGALVDFSIRWTKEFGADTENLDESLVETLDFNIDLSVGELGEVGVPVQSKKIKSRKSNQ
jgi:hypothetical protein